MSLMRNSVTARRKSRRRRARWQQQQCRCRSAVGRNWSRSCVMSQTEVMSRTRASEIARAKARMRWTRLPRYQDVCSGGRYCWSGSSMPSVHQCSTWQGRRQDASTPSTLVRGTTSTVETCLHDASVQAPIKPCLLCDLHLCHFHVPGGHSER